MSTAPNPATLAAANEIRKKLTYHLSTIYGFNADEALEKLQTDFNFKPDDAPLTGNAKRIASCKQVGGEKKRKGHKREQEFHQQFNPQAFDAPIEYGATSDTTIHPDHPICQVLRDKLGITGYNVSNKSGSNIQFTLGQIPELLDVDVAKLNGDSSFVRQMLNKYLKKSGSAAPADLLVYKDNDIKQWLFFSMDAIVEYFTTKCTWRKLDTGRIKGDFADGSKKGSRQYITYEYRPTHNSYFLGLNGGAGKKMMQLLTDKTHGIPHHFEPFNY